MNKILNNEALFRLDAFLSKNKVEYAVTGTYALHLLGVPSRQTPKDIDILIYHPDKAKEALDKLAELDFITNLTPDANYDGTCFTFIADGVKVNVILDNISDYEDIERQTVCIHLADNAAPANHLISVHKVWHAYAAKMKLGREKDKTYAIDLINLLTDWPWSR